MPTTLRCDPKLFDKDLKDQVIIVTGANSGCGLETSRQLIAQGATVILACRSEAKAKAAIADVNKTGDESKAVFIPLDLSDLSSVRFFVKTFSDSYKRLDVLINNAGIMACPWAHTKDGFEIQFGCNYLAHFLLFKELSPMLLATAKETGVPSRLVSLSSLAASEMTGFGNSLMADIDFDSFKLGEEGYDTGRAYQQSKLGNYLLALDGSDRFDESKLKCVSVNPGWVQSNLAQNLMKEGCVKNMIEKAALWSGHMIPAPDGAQTTLHCVLLDIEKLENGAFYSQFGLYKDPASKAGGWPMKLPNPNATKELAKKLWEESEKLV
jgi:NAD(P)-dependent dehydrogenase (short-subunit alcohol dehydrogenase family)